MSKEGSRRVERPGSWDSMWGGMGMREWEGEGGVGGCRVDARGFGGSGDRG